MDDNASSGHRRRQNSWSSGSGSTSEDVELDTLSDEETGLTRDRQQKQRRRRRNSRISERIAGGNLVTKEEEREADQSVLKNSLINVCLILMWYFFSLSISIVCGYPPPFVSSENKLI